MVFAFVHLQKELELAVWKCGSGFAFAAMVLTLLRRRLVMGAPEKKGFSENKEVRELSLGEKIRLLELGKETGQGLKIDKLPDIIEEARKIILPLVPWLGKPLKDFSRTEDVPKRMQKRQVILLLETDSFRIWIERSGKWILYADQLWVCETDSKDLAVAILKKEKYFADIFIREGENLIKKIPFIESAVLYHAVFSCILTRFTRAISELLMLREQRLQNMKKVLDFFRDFSHSLDPLIGGGKKVGFREFCLVEDTGRSIRFHHHGYLSEKAIEPFLSIAKMHKNEYKIRSSDPQFSNLEGFFDQIRNFLSDIESASSRNRETARDLFGWNSGRLPFSEEELEVLKKTVDSITS